MTPIDRELSPWSVALISSTVTLCLVFMVVTITHWIRDPNHPGRIVLRRGRWYPTVLSYPLSMMLLCALPVIPLSVGIDYVLPSNLSNEPEYRVLLSALPIPVWGTLCLGASLVLIAGLAMRWGWWVITGLWATGSVIAVMATGQFMAVMPNRWWDGVHDAVFSFAIALIYWGLAAGYAQQINNAYDTDNDG